jgi:hypothetical protein
MLKCVVLVHKVRAGWRPKRKHPVNVGQGPAVRDRNILLDDAERRTIISSILGRELLDSEIGDRGSLADFTAADVAELHRLREHYPMMGVYYLFFRLKERPSLNDVKSFCSEVGSLKVSVPEWVRRQDDCKRLRRSIALLEDDPFLSGIIGSTVDKIDSMGAADEPSKRHLSIGLRITEQHLTLDSLAHICQRIVQLLRASELADELGCLEIVSCRFAGGPLGEKVFELSIPSHAFESVAQGFSPAQLERPAPAEGVTCAWRRRNLVR